MPDVTTGRGQVRLEVLGLDRRSVHAHRVQAEPRVADEGDDEGLEPRAELAIRRLADVTRGDRVVGDRRLHHRQPADLVGDERRQGRVVLVREARGRQRSRGGDRRSPAGSPTRWGRETASRCRRPHRPAGPGGLACRAGGGRSAAQRAAGRGVDHALGRRG